MLQGKIGPICVFSYLFLLLHLTFSGYFCIIAIRKLFITTRSLGIKYTETEFELNGICKSFRSIPSEMDCHASLAVSVFAILVLHPDIRKLHKLSEIAHSHPSNSLISSKTLQ